MLTAQALTIFYSVCGLVVGVMLFRIWRKNRASKPLIPSHKSMKTRVPTPPVPVTPTVIVPPPPPAAAPILTPIPEGSAPATPCDIPCDVPGETRPVYVPPNYSPPQPKAIWTAPGFHKTISQSGSASWDERRLLETRGMLPRETDTMPRVLPEDIPGVDDSDRAFGSWLNPAFAASLPDSEERREEARKDLAAAGYYNPHAIENLAATRYALMMLGIILFGALLLIVPPQLEPWMVAGCILAPLLGWALPALYIRGKAKERKHEIERAMPDLLDMLNMCVGQGLTVPDSMQRIGRDFRPVYPALSQELRIVNEQAKISTMHTALENFSRRIDLPEVHSLTSLLIQTERMGTSISQALTTYSDTMRESQRQQADEKGNRATFRLLFPTVLCLMPAVYLFLLGPAVNELQKFFYAGGMDSLNSGSQVVQRVTATRSRGRNPTSGANRPVGGQR